MVAGATSMYYNVSTFIDPRLIAVREFDYTRNHEIEPESSSKLY